MMPREKVIDLYVSKSHKDKPIFRKFLKGVLGKAANSGYIVNIVDMTEVPLEAYIASRKGNNGRCVLIVGMNLFQEADILAAFKEANIPFFVINRHYADFLNINSVSINYSNAVKEITEHLIKSGRRKIAFVGFNRFSSIDRQKLEGYTSALKEYRLDFNSNYIFDYGVKKVSDSIEEFLSVVKQFDAAVCSNDSIAIMVSNALRKKGVLIPDELAITGFDNMTIGRLATPKLTTIGFSQEEIGMLAVKAVSLFQGGTKISNLKIMVNYKLLIRESSGSSPGTAINKVPNPWLENDDGCKPLAEQDYDQAKNMEYWFDEDINRYYDFERLLYSITSLELKILGMLLSKAFYKEIAAELYITERAVKYHVEKLSERLHVESGKALVRLLNSNFDASRLIRVSKRWFYRY